MKIAMVTPRFTKDIRGGGEISCKLLVDNLRKLGIEVDVITADELYPDIKDTIKLNFAMYRYLKPIMALKEYDVVHTYNMQLLPTVGILTKKYNLKSVGTLNGHIFSPTFERRYSKHPIRCSAAAAGLLRTQIKHITRFTVLGECWRKIWINDGIPADKIQVIQNMIPMDAIRYSERESDTVKIVVVGNSAIWRKVKNILNAYEKLPKQKICLYLIGSGWDKEYDEYKGANTLHYCENLSHRKTLELTSEADIYVQWFEYTGVGRSMLEAALSGAALVTNGAKEDYGALSEAALFFQDESFLVNRLQYLINNKSERRIRGLDARMIALEKYNPMATTKRHIKIYKELLND